MLLTLDGEDVIAVPLGRSRTPDVTVGGEAIEIKCLRPGATNATVRNRVGRAKGQARRVLIDARESGLTMAEAQRGLHRARGAYSSKLEWVRIVGDGYDASWRAGSTDVAIREHPG